MYIMFIMITFFVIVYGLSLMSETYGAFLFLPTVWPSCDSNPIIYCFEFVYISSNLAS